MNIIHTVKSLGLPFGQYIVTGSGILDVLGIRRANDIDIIALPRLHAELRATGEWQEEIVHNGVILRKGVVEILPQLSREGYETTTQEGIDTATVIDGVPFLNLEELRKFKQAYGREKDRADLLLIGEYLRRQEG